MILTLNHKSLNVYDVARKMVSECYMITRNFPPVERYNLIQQINRAALSVILNIAEGASRKSAVERRRFYEIARGSIIELDAALQILTDLQYINEDSINDIKPLITSSFSMLSKMIKTLSSN